MKRIQKALSFIWPSRNVFPFLLGLFLFVLLLFLGIKTIGRNDMLVAPLGTISLEYAKTASERETGLMNRQKLDDNTGMLFVFDRGEANCFWMKDTFMPLDMIWLDHTKKVVFVHQNAVPQSETSLCPDAPATYVLEVNAGQADKLGLVVGAQADF